MSEITLDPIQVNELTSGFYYSYTKIHEHTLILDDYTINYARINQNVQ